MNASARTLIALALFTAGLLMGGLIALSWKPSQHAARAAGSNHEQPPAAVWEATVFVPLANNEGQPFPDELWQRALDVLVADFGGATLGQMHEGCWLDAQKRIRREPVRPVIVSFDRGRLDEFRLAVREVGRRLGQEVMYVRLQEPRVELLTVLGTDPERSR